MGAAWPAWVSWLLLIAILLILYFSWMTWRGVGRASDRQALESKAGRPIRTRGDLEEAYTRGAISRDMYERWRERLT